MRLQWIGWSVAIAAAALVVLAACQSAEIADMDAGQKSRKEGASPSVHMTIPEAAALANVTIAEKGVDWDNDGKREKLSIVLTEGRLVDNADPGPYEGECYIGRFAAILTDRTGQTLHSLDLGAGFPDGMIFRKGTFDIPFEDYNSDGYPEFTIGQYASSNGNSFNMYTIRPEGISQLASGIFTSGGDGYYSIQYPKASSASFLNRYYDNSRGLTFESTFVWDGERFVKQGEKEAAGAWANSAS